ncbi:hypothetical protein [Caballeronia sp. LZ034LL]|uniref:hypothetical protein n=1 Tax=Caballeronia sp. LZ034LL TaxID=3038567 RepID=UPI0028629A94|nr:hypothetical protein [Caballeronia sp. LZ034LL]MDR5839357.1 hypothetical protein [Caballeronia sp. LZ034LL]
MIHSILVRIQEDQAKLRTEMREAFVKLGLQVGSLEGGMGLVLHYAGDRAQNDAAVNKRIAAVEQQIQDLRDTIEHLKHAQ